MILVQFFEQIARFFLSNKVNERFAQKNERFDHSLIYHEQPEQIAQSHSFVMSDLSEFAHSRSFVLSDLSESLTVAHLIWAIWAN